MVRSAEVACVGRIVAHGSLSGRIQEEWIDMNARRPRTRRHSHVNRATRHALPSVGAGGDCRTSESRTHHPEHVQRMTWLRVPMILVPPALILAALYTQCPRAVDQDTGVPAKPADAARLQPPASAPASQAVKPGQPQVPQPTVMLKPGEVPGITFKEPAYDFGRVRSGTDVTHDFEFTNTGNGPLEILLVKPG
jgi:hypothetical protein